MMNATIDNGLAYTRTEKGNDEVISKTLALSARQRQFLLLIDKTDTLNKKICARLSRSINVDQLVDLGLVNCAVAVKHKFDEATENNSVTHYSLKSLHSMFVNDASEKNYETAELINQETDKAASIETPVFIDEPNINANTRSVTQTKELKGFVTNSEVNEIKNIMIASLNAACGSNAKDLVQKVIRSSSINELKRLNTKWRNALMKTSFDKTQIATWFDDVTERLYY